MYEYKKEVIPWNCVFEIKVIREKKRNKIHRNASPSYNQFQLLVTVVVIFFQVFSGQIRSDEHLNVINPYNLTDFVINCNNQFRNFRSHSFLKSCVCKCLKCVLTGR